MGDLATTEAQVNAHFMTLLEKLTSCLHLYFDVMSISLESETDLLDVDLFLIASAFLQVFILLVTIFSPIDDAYNGGRGLRGYLDEVEASIFSMSASFC